MKRVGFAAVLVFGGLVVYAAGRPVKYAVRLAWLRPDLPEVQAQAIAAIMVALKEAE